MELIASKFILPSLKKNTNILFFGLCVFDEECIVTSEKCSNESIWEARCYFAQLPCPLFVQDSTVFNSNKPILTCASLLTCEHPIQPFPKTYRERQTKRSKEMLYLNSAQVFKTTNCWTRVNSLDNAPISHKRFSISDISRMLPIPLFLCFFLLSVCFLLSYFYNSERHLCGWYQETKNRAYLQNYRDLSQCLNCLHSYSEFPFISLHSH